MPYCVVVSNQLQKSPTYGKHNFLPVSTAALPDRFRSGTDRGVFRWSEICTDKHSFRKLENGARMIWVLKRDSMIPEFAPSKKQKVALLHYCTPLPRRVSTQTAASTTFQTFHIVRIIRDSRISRLNWNMVSLWCEGLTWAQTSTVRELASNSWTYYRTEYPHGSLLLLLPFRCILGIALFWFIGGVKWRILLLDCHSHCRGINNHLSF